MVYAIGIWSHRTIDCRGKKAGTHGYHYIQASGCWGISPRGKQHNSSFRTSKNADASTGGYIIPSLINAISKRRSFCLYFFNPAPIDEGQITAYPEGVRLGIGFL